MHARGMTHVCGHSDGNISRTELQEFIVNSGLVLEPFDNSFNQVVMIN